ncbi:hypothetical protein [Paraburkholderia bannensis]|uniref:hypothetical protein n=1 Tax=Paraburkholderia bannensis TaxID=765414 RepID=UPI002AB797B1|nr:hypothetical protein [Paraburkholderia bannensis]
MTRLAEADATRRNARRAHGTHCRAMRALEEGRNAGAIARLPNVLAQALQKAFKEGLTKGLTWKARLRRIGRRRSAARRKKKGMERARRERPRCISSYSSRAGECKTRPSHMLLKLPHSFAIEMKRKLKEMERSPCSHVRML